MVEIAIFPIPNCVTFPGQVASLHVFEPRYRLMVEDCLKENRPLAVCGTGRLLEKTREKNLIATQAPRFEQRDAFEPLAVVAYGEVELLERLEDGRLLIEVRMKKRARLNAFLKREPYYIALAEEVDDKKTPPSASQSLLRAEISAKFQALWSFSGAENASLPFSLDLLSFENLSFQILGLLQTDPVLAQLQLEETNPEKRASVLLDILCSMENRMAS